MDTQKFKRTARDWFIAILCGIAFCIATADDMRDEEIMAQHANELAAQTKSQAKVNAKAQQIAAEMLNTPQEQ